MPFSAGNQGSIVDIACLEWEIYVLTYKWIALLHRYCEFGMRDLLMDIELLHIYYQFRVEDLVSIVAQILQVGACQ